jgi:hypothetical protein
MQAGLPVLANVNEGNDLVELIERERVGHACTDNSVEVLVQLVNRLVDTVPLDRKIGARCQALSTKLFSSEAAARQITASLSRSAGVVKEQSVGAVVRAEAQDAELQREDA